MSHPQKLHGNCKLKKERKRKRTQVVEFNAHSILLVLESRTYLPFKNNLFTLALFGDLLSSFLGPVKVYIHHNLWEEQEYGLHFFHTCRNVFVLLHLHRANLQQLLEAVLQTRKGAVLEGKKFISKAFIFFFLFCAVCKSYFVSFSKKEHKWKA